ALQRAGTVRTDATVVAITSRIAALPADTVSFIRASVTGGAAAVASIVAVAAVAVAVRLVGNYAEIIALYESGHAGVLGGVSLTIAQLAFLPNLIVWAASWLIGPGFA